MALLVTLIGLFLPSKIHVERSIVVNTTPEVPFELLNDLSRFNDWSPWYDEYVAVDIDVGNFARDVLMQDPDDWEVTQPLEEVMAVYCEQIDKALDQYLEDLAAGMLDALETEYDWLTSFECWLEGEYVVDDETLEHYGLIEVDEEVTI